MAGIPQRQLLSGAVLVAAMLAILGSEEDHDGTLDFRWPCDFATEHSPGAPLVVYWADQDDIDLTTPGLAESIWLEDASGAEIPLLRSVRGDGLVVFCPQGGLDPVSGYRWNLEAMDHSDHHEWSPRHSLPGWYQLATGPQDGTAEIATQAACDAVVLPDEVLQAWSQGCDPCRDEGSCSGAHDSGGYRR